MKHRLTFTDEDLAILEERLEVVEPMKYDLHTFALLKNLYGRICRLRLHQRPVRQKPKFKGVCCDYTKSHRNS